MAKLEQIFKQLLPYRYSSIPHFLKAILNMWHLQQVWTSNCGLHNHLSCSNLASGVIVFEHRSRCLPHLILDIQRNAGKGIVFTHEKFNTCQFLMNVSRMFHSNILNKVVHTGLLRPHAESHYWCKFSITNRKGYFTAVFFCYEMVSRTWHN